MFDRIRDAYDDYIYYFQHFNLPRKIGASLGILFNAYQVTRIWADVTSSQNSSLLRQICEAASSCTVPINTVPLTLMITAIVDLILFKIYRSWTEQVDRDLELETQEQEAVKNFRGADELVKWAELLEKGHITQADFDKKKREILGED